jgi:hypothetical protein
VRNERETSKKIIFAATRDLLGDRGPEVRTISFSLLADRVLCRGVCVYGDERIRIDSFVFRKEANLRLVLDSCAAIRIGTSL